MFLYFCFVFYLQLLLTMFYYNVLISNYLIQFETRLRKKTGRNQIEFEKRI